MSGDLYPNGTPRLRRAPDDPPPAVLAAYLRGVFERRAAAGGGCLTRGEVGELAAASRAAVDGALGALVTAGALYRPTPYLYELAPSGGA